MSKESIHRIAAALSDHDGQVHNEEATDLRNGEDPLAEDDTQEYPGMPGKGAYNGLGKSLMESPRKTLHHRFVRGGVLKLDTRFENESSEGAILCIMECKMLHNGDVVIDHGTGMSKVCVDRA